MATASGHTQERAGVRVRPAVADTTVLVQFSNYSDANTVFIAKPWPRWPAPGIPIDAAGVLRLEGRQQPSGLRPLRRGSDQLSTNHLVSVLMAGKWDSCMPGATAPQAR